MSKGMRNKRRRALYSNLDINLSDSERKEESLIEQAGALVEDNIASTGTMDSGGIVDKTKPVVVTQDQLNDKGAELRPVKPIAIEDNGRGGWDYILTPFDYAMVKQGKVCAKCLEWQESSTTLRCMWKGKSSGCGHKKVIEYDLSYLKPGDTR